MKLHAFSATTMAAAALILSYNPSAFAFDNSFGQNNLPVHSPIKMTQLESESGGVFFGGGDSESGGIYGGEASSESSTQSSSESGGTAGGEAASESGGASNSGTSSESGGVGGAAGGGPAPAPEGGPGVEVKNY